MNFLQLLRSVAIVSIISSGLVLATSFLFSFWMSKESFGEYTYWYSVHLILLNFVQFGSVAAATVYRYQTEGHNYKVIMSRSLYAIMPLCLFFLYVVFLLVDQVLSIYDISNILYLAPLSAFFYANTLVLISIYRTEQNMKLYSIVFMVLSVCLFMSQAGSYLIYELHESVIVSFVLVCSLFYLFSNAVFFRHYNFTPALLTDDYDSTIDRLSYGFPLVLSSVLMSILTMADRLYLKNNISAEGYGVYSTVVVICSIILFAVNNFAMAWGGYLFKNIPSMDSGEIRLLFNKGQRLILPVIIVVSIILIPTVVLVHRFLYGQVTKEFTIALILIGFGYLLYGVSKYYIGYMMAYKKNVDVLKATLVGVFAVFLCLYYSEINVVINASGALLIGFLFQFLYVFIFANYKLKRVF